ncbi:hypothetical protein HRbin15_02374 [bacterium HR15]|nr:hypothetical protein HRbin15_02374 [bacterium HR15]
MSEKRPCEGDPFFEEALRIVLEHEDGYVNNPKDPGGATNKGITQSTYDAYRRKKGRAPQDVRYIEDDEVWEIYCENYWQASGADKLPPPLNIVHFDTAVNMGVGRANEFLNQVDPSLDLCTKAEEYLKLRKERYRKIAAKNQNLSVFLNGWLNRVASLRKYVQNHSRCRKPPSQATPSPVRSAYAGSLNSFLQNPIGAHQSLCTQLSHAASTPPVISKPDTDLIKLARQMWRSGTRGVQKAWQWLRQEEIYNAGIVIRGNKEFREKVKENLDFLYKTRNGRQILNALDAAGKKGKITVITESKYNWCKSLNDEDAFVAKAYCSKDGRIIITTRGKGSGSVVGYNPRFEPKYPDGRPCRPPVVGLAHELIHAMHNANGENLRRFIDMSDPDMPQGSNHEEARTIGRGAYENEFPSENSLRDELGFERRTSHASVCPLIFDIAPSIAFV